MAKELPFFKFEISEWMFGRIQKQPLEVQGTFINLCCKYWHKLGEYTYQDVILDFDNSHVDALIQNKIIGGDSFIFIKFLDSQLDECAQLSKQNSINGLKSALARAQRKLTTVEPSSTEAQRNPTEEKRREEKRERGDESPALEERKKEFYNTLATHKSQYSKKLLREFYDYWTEHSHKGKKMRFEKQIVFDVVKRLATWAKREGIEPPEKLKPPDFSYAEFDKKDMVPTEWEKLYEHKLTTDGNFREYFGFKLQDGKPMAINNGHEKGAG